MRGGLASGRDLVRRRLADRHAHGLPAGRHARRHGRRLSQRASLRRPAPGRRRERRVQFRDGGDAGRSGDAAAMAPLRCGDIEAHAGLEPVPARAGHPGPRRRALQALGRPGDRHPRRHRVQQCVVPGRECDPQAPGPFRERSRRPRGARLGHPGGRLALGRGRGPRRLGDELPVRAAPDLPRPAGARRAHRLDSGPAQHLHGGACLRGRVHARSAAGVPGARVAEVPRRLRGRHCGEQPGRDCRGADGGQPQAALERQRSGFARDRHHAIRQRRRQGSVQRLHAHSERARQRRARHRPKPAERAPLEKAQRAASLQGVRGAPRRQRGCRPVLLDPGLRGRRLRSDLGIGVPVHLGSPSSSPPRARARGRRRGRRQPGPRRGRRPGGHPRGVLVPPAAGAAVARRLLPRRPRRRGLPLHVLRLRPRRHSDRAHEGGRGGDRHRPDLFLLVGEHDCTCVGCRVLLHLVADAAA
mmetsp:Transcript_12135/g.34775  ORF Transcript_12135/g.34775 Transcript_12135/m.34775 type:complete len:472 (+) Transcript_12135:585-2000(+)